jgi:predicted dehydrogenase
MSEENMQDQKSIQVALIGYGYWGPNLARNFYQLPGVNLEYVVDRDEPARQRAERLYNCKATDHIDDVLADQSVDAVIIATPARTHYALAKRALEAGKHVFVEKPLTMDVGQAEEVVALADRRRVNLGRVQSDVNVLWSIAPHDISIALHLLGQMPVAVRCQGASCLSGDVEDVIFLTMFFPNNILCHVHASWLDPSKTREMTVVGSRKMIVYDDVSAEGKVRVYDKGAFRKGDVTYGDFQYKLHSGDILIPRLDMREPLQLECAHFIDCIRSGNRPLTDGENGLRVLKVLAAGDRSLRSGGSEIPL